VNHARDEPQGGEMASTDEWKKYENSASHNIFLYLFNCLLKC